MLKIVPVILVSVFAVGFSSAQNWELDREKAEAQHEIVMLLIKEGSFDQVAKESAKLFSLRHPVEQEGLVVKSASVICEALREKGQHDLVLKVLDQAIKSLSIERNQGTLVKEKAYTYKKLGRDREAMEAFVESTRLLEQGKKTQDKKKRDK